MTSYKALIIGVEDYKDPQFKKRLGTLTALREIELRLQQGGWQTRFLHNGHQQISQRAGLTQILEAIDELKNADHCLVLISTHIVNRRLIPYDARYAFLEQSSLSLDEILVSLPAHSGLLLDAMLSAESIKTLEWVISAGKESEGNLALFSSYGPSSFLHACTLSLNHCPLDQELSVANLFNMMRTYNAPHTLCHYFSEDASNHSLLSPIPLKPNEAKSIKSMPLNPGQSRFMADGRYHILRMIGEGGIGQVYLAYDNQLKVYRAIKVMKLPKTLKESERIHLHGRSLQAARAAQALSEYTHHVVHVYDLGIDNQSQSPFTVMEYVDGVTLSHRLQRQALSLDQVYDICLQLAETIGIAHEQAMVHRDLKPDNIMLIKRGDQENYVKLLDFDLVKMESSEVKTKEGQILGTLEYMSPEQLRGADIKASADVYAFGAILYECLSGYRANSGKTQRELIKTLLDTGVTPLETRAPHIPQVLCNLVNQCLSLDPELRPPNGLAVHHTLLKLQKYKSTLSRASIMPWTQEGQASHEQILQIRLEKGQYDTLTPHLGRPKISISRENHNHINSTEPLEETTQQNRLNTLKQQVLQRTDSEKVSEDLKMISEETFTQESNHSHSDLNQLTSLSDLHNNQSANSKATLQNAIVSIETSSVNDQTSSIDNHTSSIDNHTSFKIILLSIFSLAMLFFCLYLWFHFEDQGSNKDLKSTTRTHLNTAKDLNSSSLSLHSSQSQQEIKLNISKQDSSNSSSKTSSNLIQKGDQVVHGNSTTHMPWSPLPSISLLPIPGVDWSEVKVKLEDQYRVYYGGGLAEQLALLTYESHFRKFKGEKIHKTWQTNTELRKILLTNLPLAAIQQRQGIRLAQDTFQELLANRPKMIELYQLGTFLKLPHAFVVMESKGCPSLTSADHVTEIRASIKGYRGMKYHCTVEQQGQECHTKFKKIYGKAKSVHEKLRLKISYFPAASMLQKSIHLNTKTIRCSIR
jgi:serine/threonine protein kinase